MGGTRDGQREGGGKDDTKVKMSRDVSSKVKRALSRVQGRLSQTKHWNLVIWCRSWHVKANLLSGKGWKPVSCQETCQARQNLRCQGLRAGCTTLKPNNMVSSVMIRQGKSAVCDGVKVSAVS